MVSFSDNDGLYSNLELVEVDMGAVEEEAEAEAVMVMAVVVAAAAAAVSALGRRITQTTWLPR